MKIQLSSTLPFTPVQLDAQHVQQRRAVGQLSGAEGGREFRTAVYAFRHSDDDVIHYQIDPRERVYLDDARESNSTVLPPQDTFVSPSLEWIEHHDGLNYKPYSFLIMNAMTKLVADWDGVIYQTPRGERLRDTAVNATLQIIDACVCSRFGLWGMVNLTGEKFSADALPTDSRQQGWVPL